MSGRGTCVGLWSRRRLVPIASVGDAFARTWRSPLRPSGRDRKSLIMDVVACLPTFEELRAHVRHLLCEHDHLDAQQTPLFQQLLVRRGKPCGLRFEVQGPRRLRCSRPSYSCGCSRRRRASCSAPHPARAGPARIAVMKTQAGGNPVRQTCQRQACNQRNPKMPVHHHPP